MKGGRGGLGKRGGFNSRTTSRRGWNTSLLQSQSTGVREGSDSKHRDALEVRFGIEQFNYIKNEDHGKRRQGYLFNIRPVIESIHSFELDKTVRRSGVSLYFVDGQAITFRSTYFFCPYFFVDVSDELGGVKIAAVDDYRFQIVQMLAELAKERCQEVALVQEDQRIDLSYPQHLQQDENTIYKCSNLIRLTFQNIDDFKTMRREISGFITRHHKVAEEVRVVLRQICGDSTATKDAQSSQGGLLSEIKNRISQDPRVLIKRELEADVGYTARVCINSNIRCGKWYNIQLRRGEEPAIIPEPDHLQGNPPPLRYLAWDIEVTKDPLKFPDAHKDSISLISYMCEGHGFLIVNRSLLSRDINSFEYTPRPEFPGKFKIFNVPTEKDVIMKFFSHIQQLSPHILVTYNGDNFDFEFLRIRSKKYGISMLDQIGFPYSTNDGVPPVITGLPIKVRTAMGDRQEYQGRIMVHLDCLRWVERDSYLPCGSRGLKAVTRVKLRYHPRELDPELMVTYQTLHPRLLAEYSVSDAVATYYLYHKFIHNFTFALASIIPLPPDDVLRKGSGTLCEHLLMAEAFIANVVFPNKHLESLEKWHGDSLLVSETYVGGNVAQLNSGIFRCDVAEKFTLNPLRYQALIDTLDAVFNQWLTNEDGKEISHERIENLEEIKNEIRQKLEYYKENPNVIENPVIYHFDVAAMYPNIILTNRLQPTSIVNDHRCSLCPYSSNKKQCQKPMQWKWKAERFPLNRAQIELVRDQLSNELFDLEDDGRVPKDHTKNSSGSSSDEDGNLSSEETGNEKKKNGKRMWTDLTEKQQNKELIERLKLLSRKQSRKFKIATEEIRTDTVCMRENPFYVQTVQDFRDRRYIFKVRKKEAEKKLEEAVDEAQRILCAGEVVLYDSLQLAHKCILNSFYGYVMRKGARWYSMEMAAIVTFVGAEIIRSAHRLAEDLGTPLELDTDGIWVLLPQEFPQSYKIEYTTENGDKKSKYFDYPCTLLNLGVHKDWTNNQYLSWNVNKHLFERRSENSIFFEVDGPYKAMILPASEKEGQSLKKRYAVFDMNNEISELKGFEIKRRGELEVIKIFQEEVFPQFLKGKTKAEAYDAAAEVANRWLDFIETQGRSADNVAEVFELISESKFLSKPAKVQANMKSMGLTTARRLTELLGDPTYIEDKGIKCEYVVLANDQLEKNLRAVPPVSSVVDSMSFRRPSGAWTQVQLFEQSVEDQKLYLHQWLGLSFPKAVATIDPRSLIDWSYYRQRLATAILKIITIPALHQGLANPVPRIVPPDWLKKNDLSNQTKLTSFFRLAAADTVNAVLNSSSSQECQGRTDDIENVVTDEVFDTVMENVSQQSSELQTEAQLDLELEVAQPDDEIGNKYIESWVSKCQKRFKILRQSIKKSQKQQRELQETISGIRRSSMNCKAVSRTVHLTLPKLPVELFQNAKVGAGREFHEWTILDIEPDPNELGIFHFSIVIKSLSTSFRNLRKLYRVPIYHMRNLLVNSWQPLNVAPPGICIKMISPNRKIILPRDLNRCHLTELSMEESQFRLHSKTLRPNENIISVHGCNTPLEFDLLKNYGNSVRLNSSNGAIQISTHSEVGETIVGPDSFEAVGHTNDEIVRNAKSTMLQWLFISIFHQGPLEHPERVAVFILQPPLRDDDTNNLISNGSCVILTGGGTREFHLAAQQFAPKKLFQKILLDVSEAEQRRFPSFLLDSNMKMILNEWEFSAALVHNDMDSCFNRLSNLINQHSIRALAKSQPPLGISLFTSLPSFMIGDWADSSKRLRGGPSICLFHSNDNKAYGQLPKFSKFNFIGNAFEFSVRQFTSDLFAVEWCAVFSAVIQAPLLWVLRQGTSLVRLQRVLFDLTFVRALKANEIVSWETESPCPDLGTFYLIADSPMDFELPTSRTKTLLVNPSISWSFTFRFDLGDQLFVETISHLDILAKHFDDPLKFFFSDSSIGHPGGRRRAMFATAGSQSKNNSQESSQEETFLSHSSDVSPKVLVVLRTAILHIQNSVQVLSSVVASSTSSALLFAIGFLQSSLRLIHSWLASPSSLLFDPALDSSITQWTRRYLRAMTTEIERVSESLLRILLVSPSFLVLATPILSHDKAIECVRYLFDELRGNPLFQNLNPKGFEAYRAFLQFDSISWVAVSVKRSAPVFHLPTLKYLPAPLRHYVRKAIKDLLLVPLREINDGEKSGRESCTFANLRAIALQLFDLRGPLLSKWLHSFAHFDEIREGWIDDGEANTWEKNYREEMSRQCEIACNRLKTCPDSQISAVQRTIHHIKNSMRLSKTVMLEQCWDIPQRPGCYRIETKQVISGGLHPGVKYDREGREARIIRTVNRDQLQLELARILLYLLSLHPQSSDLPQEQCEAVEKLFCDTLTVSSFSDQLKYKPLWQSLCLDGILCSECEMIIQLDVIGELEETNDGPLWRCPSCHQNLTSESIEGCLTDSIFRAVEAAQVQECVCRKCRELKKDSMRTYCHCGGEYHLRTPNIEFQLFFQTVRSLVEMYPLDFSYAIQCLDQLRSCGA